MSRSRYSPSLEVQAASKLEEAARQEEVLRAEIARQEEVSRAERQRLRRIYQAIGGLTIDEIAVIMEAIKGGTATDNQIVIEILEARGRKEQI